MEGKNGQTEEKENKNGQEMSNEKIKSNEGPQNGNSPASPSN